MDQKFDNILQQEFPKDGPGATVLIAQKGRIIYRNAFGLANLEHKIPMSPDKVFRIGSITKQFTSSAILKLAEEGKLNLDDDLTKFLPEYPTNGKTITIEHLLTHTSGLKSYTQMNQWDDEVRRKDFTPEAMVEFFKDEPMDFEPGEEFRYNNSGYFLLGYIIEKVTGKTYAEYIQEAFYTPLGMTNSYYGAHAPIIKNRASGYSNEGSGYTNTPYLSMTQPYAAGSLLSNVDDIFTWYQAVMNGKVLNKASLEKAHSPYKLNNGKPVGYGYGWFLGYLNGSRVIEHGGGINGFLTASIYLPEEDVFVALFSNCDCKPPQEIAKRLALETIGKPFNFKKIEVQSKDLEEYVAVYESEFDQQNIITVEEGQLFMMMTGDDRKDAIPYAKDQFYFERDNATLIFERDDAGKIARAIYQGSYLPSHWKRTNKPVPVKETIAVDPEKLKEYEGDFELFRGFVMTVYAEGDQIFARATGQQAIEIFPEAADKFFAKAVDGTIEFTRNDNGEVATLILNQGGQRFEGQKSTNEKSDTAESIKVDAKTLQTYVGEYQLAPGFSITISLDEDQLKAQGTGQPAFSIFPETETLFYTKVVDAKIEFVKNDAGAVDKMILYQNGNEMPGVKQ